MILQTFLEKITATAVIYFLEDNTKYVKKKKSFISDDNVSKWIPTMQHPFINFKKAFLIKTVLQKFQKEFFRQ